MRSYIKHLVCAALALTLCASVSAISETADKAPANAGASVIDVTDILNDPVFALRAFSDYRGAGGLTTENEKISVFEQADGSVLISGPYTELMNTRFLLDEHLDLGSNRLQRVMLTALGQRGVATEILFYLDGAEEPAFSIRPDAQKAEGSWEQETWNMNTVVSGLNITGSHKTEFSIRVTAPDGTVKTKGTGAVLLKKLQFVAETVPLVSLTLDESFGTIGEMNGDASHNAKCYGTMEILPTGIDAGSAPADYAGGTYALEFIKGRGNSTWNPEYKLPYKIKLQADADLFGMGANRHWALIANSFDKDTVRNPLTYTIGQKLGLQYTPEYTNVDVLMNGRYIGNYMLCETIRVGESRVNIDDPDDGVVSENITGGYLLGTAAYGADEDAYVFTTEDGVEFNVNSPADTGDPDYEKETAYIKAYMQRIENALDGREDPETGKVEDPFELMDLDSAVAFYWVQELSTNGDFFYTGSTYCYKVKDGKLYWGPLWDFDIAWSEQQLTTDFWVNRVGWFRKMLANETFLNACTEYYENTLRPLMDDILSEDGFLETYFRNTEYAVINNYTLWGFENNDGESFTEPDRIREAYESCHEDFAINVFHRAQWCSESLEYLRTQPVQLIFRVDGETIAEQTEYAGACPEKMPETPVKESMRFVEWQCRYIDEDGEPCEGIIESESEIPSEYIEEADGGYRLVLNAVFEEIDESRHVTGVRFQQSSYHIAIDPDLKTPAPRIPFTLLPADGYADEIVWNNEDPDVLDFGFDEGLLTVTPKKDGKSRVTATLKDGTVCGVDISVHTLTKDEKACIDLYTMMDFSLSAETLTLHEGDTAFLSIEVSDHDDYYDFFDSKNREYVWYTASGTACSVEEGTVTAEEAGVSVIACRNIAGDIIRLCTVTVEP